MTSFNNVPAPISSAIQTGLLDRTFKQALTAELGFRDIATRMDFPGEIGQTLTFTKPGLMPAQTTPLSSRSNTDLTDGLTAVNYSLEQYVVGIDSYANTMQLQLASASMAIDSLFLQNAYALGENAKRSLDLLAYNTLMDSYLGYNTRVIVTLGSPNASIAVDDVRGFFETVSNASGQVIATSASNPLTVLVNGTSYTLNTVVADGVRPTLPSRFNNLTFSGTSSNSSTTPGGYSGTLTFTAAVSTTNGTAGNTVVASIAPTIIRGGTATNASKLVSGNILTMQMIRTAMNQMRANAVRGSLTAYIDDYAYGTLMQDTEFRQYLQTRDQSREFRDGYYGRVMGVDFVRSNNMFIDTNTLTGGQTIHRSIIVGDGALLEADFTARAYANAVQEEVSLISQSDNIAHITRPPINVLGDVVTQTWAAYLGFVCPTDVTTNPTTNVLTATNACRKRAIVLESTGS
jgi:hypothetical protein